MSHPTFSIVVPIIPRHHRYAKRLVKNLMGGSVKPVEIIFAGSSQSEISAQVLEAVQELFPDIVRLHLTEDKCTAGQNRNRGWEIARGEYISFCDADDLYSLKRLETLQNEIIRTDADLIIHDYFFQLPSFTLNLMGRKYQVIEGSELFESTFPEGRRNRVMEFGTAGESNILMPPEFASIFRIQHGHATVKSSVKVRYSDYPYAEDGIFCRDILYEGHNVVYVSAKLSIYETFSLRGIVQNSTLRAIAEINRLKRHGIRFL
jgi:glycosyltransferase involved in cell wall biosynthesis